MATRLTGWAAIAFAEKNNCKLGKKAESTEPARDDVEIAEARRIAQVAPDLIYVEFDELPPTNVG
jgi:hypothetical protein